MTLSARQATDRLKNDLYRVVDSLRADLDRVEILIAALNVFSRPVPNYEPRFQHLQQFGLKKYEIGQRAGDDR